MRIKTRLLCTLLGMSLLVALLGTLAVNRQYATAMAGVREEAEDVARLVSFLLMSDANKLSGAALQEIVEKLHQAEGRDIVVMDAHQLVLADAIPAEIGTIFRNDPEDEVGKTIKDGRVRTFVEVSPAYPAGIKQIVVPIEDGAGQVTGAVVLEYTPLYNEMMRLTRTTVWEVVLAAIGSVVLSLLLALYIGKSIAGPLGLLTKVATGFASGRTDLPMPDPRKDEIGELATAFGDMMEKRQRAEADLSRLRDELEMRVTERTHELATANAALHEGLATSARHAAVLRESEEKFHQLADNITDVFWMTSPDFQTIHFVSAGYESVWGRSRESLYADPHQWVESILPEERAGVFGIFGELAGDVPEVSIEYRIVQPDGTVRWIHDRGFQVRNAAGEVVRVTGIARDITEQKQAAEALTELSQRTERRERMLTTTLSFLSDFAYIFDREGRFVFANQPLLDLWGLTLEEVVGRDFHDLRYPDDLAAKLQRQVNQVFETKQSVTDETPYTSPAGLAGCYEYIFSPAFAADGSVDFVVGSTRDITERKRAEAELSQAKELAEAASRAKSEFLANMSHEIRTPMNGIIGMTGLVLDTRLTREQREYLGMAQTSAHALLGLINNILDFSKIEAGKLELEAIGFSLRDCLGAMLKPLGLRADQKGLELTAEIPPEVPDYLVGDPLRLQQVLVNLTDNAIKFTARGDIMLRVAAESTPGAGHCLHFTVSDTGIGIPKAKQALIFEAFAQADGTTTRNYGGTGLGLAIASQLVGHMGGRIWIESTPGVGTTFHFTARLPVQPSPAQSRPMPRERGLGGMPVLVVDDNAVNRRIMRDMLANWRMQPSVVASGPAAIVELLRAAHAGTPFPLVILDAVMPEMDGFMVAEQIREHAELHGATVMMLSSAMPRGATQRCLELGVAGYLLKPVTESELFEAILAALEGVVVENSPGWRTEPKTPAQPKGRRILLVEDNAINRALAAGILERRGHSLVHAANGLEAVEAAAGEVFDLILMDVQMPEMDGFAATQRIRELERPLRRHTPIVAMTAHALVGDRERCLEAGMDDYLSKPLHKAELLEMIDRAITDGSRRPADLHDTLSPILNSNPLQPAVPSPAPPQMRAPALFSREELLDQADGDEAMMRQMIALFHENTPRLMEDIRHALAQPERAELSRAAHALLSSLGIFGATTAYQLTQSLERPPSDPAHEHHRLFAALEREVAEVGNELTSFLPA